ncbi:type I glutamate--ammonia ligase [candidate division CPR3 bacterium GWF2_35_18]|uniref:Glutamine synthetase n=1 Tax=candidate division CPR3 bacterium GW2011_GWF2_35_18 TaxID=1618350 RepID=A0A0G0BL61_UNCC3|nr:MAG: putative glutamate-ammonia ligase GlnA [candidate division CPR3 bacterium GW2011_GWF2_35_18]OGB63440.1 MAG: type I glutamate--ammonia ligase [candidate division CPR3 bacterium GWF2_35_18]OGB64815.1 MAG: type I glutamate--ammonia ligase [candidate division CPR3 bacterium RIFOXYA2_FULL_35_13]OGB78557.1 MAG: type I glutamate--ammonia ligase [candidate division CPR3 bacterium RIFOXYB2_FULL_35_8]
MDKKTILEKVREDKVAFIDVQFTDFFGTLKSTTIPVNKLGEALDHGVWFDGSSVQGFTRIFESDMYLMPDLSTYAVIPWQNDGRKSARFIADVYTVDGKPFEGDPRYILKKALLEARELGFQYFVGPELEFFLFPLTETGEINFSSKGNRSYFKASLNDTYAIRQEITKALAKFGIEVEMAHTEVADNQHEIDFKYDVALKTADNALTFKFVTKHIARKMGYHATFMPKPFFGINGSGMHVHQSLFDLEGQTNLFSNVSDPYGLSQTAYHFIAGQLKYIREIVALTSPTVNSYKRLTPGYEAPVYICWARRNRSAMIRVPSIFAGREKSTRAELRCPDPSSNPYLTFAAMLKSGLKGIKEKENPPMPVEEDVYEFDEEKLREFYIHKLPGSLKEALDLYGDSFLARQIMGERTHKLYLEAKMQEWDLYRLHVTDWELERYLETL